MLVCWVSFMLSIVYAESRKISTLCWVSLWWVPLCWVSLCCMSLCWVSWRRWQDTAPKNKRRYALYHNGTQYNDIELNDTQHNGLNWDIPPKDFRRLTKVALCWMSLCWMSWHPVHHSLAIFITLFHVLPCELTQ